jgi:hypothetical protein
MPKEYTGKKWFTIHENDAGTEAYRNEYVEWLEEESKRLEDILRRIFPESCGNCRDNGTCEFAWDRYNIDCDTLDCLGAK